MPLRTPDRLSGLVEDGILQRQPDPEHGGRHLYELTAIGGSLWPVLHALLVWGDRHRHPNSRAFKHAACGTRLDDNGYGPSSYPRGVACARVRAVLEGVI